MSKGEINLSSQEIGSLLNWVIFSVKQCWYCTATSKGIVLLSIIVYQGFDTQLAARTRGFRGVHKLWGGLLKNPTAKQRRRESKQPDHGVARREEAVGGAQWEEVGVGCGLLCSWSSAMTWRGTGEPDELMNPFEVTKWSSVLRERCNVTHFSIT